jgi:release factor glutamine methyltransferase
MTTIVNAINRATTQLSAAGVTNARLDAEVLLSHIMNRDRAWLFTHIHDALEDKTRRVFEGAVERRSKREPLQYIIGKQEFWGLDYVVTPDVLIPRPETELVVESALKIIRSKNKPVTIVDLCTGSGCIAISLAKELKASRVFAVDKSNRALNIAKENARKHGVSDLIRFLEGDLYQPLEMLDIHGGVDIIVSNPPYVQSGDYDTLQPEVRDFEPAMALFAGQHGTEIHCEIIAGAPVYLKLHGALIMEMGIGQAEFLTKMAQDTGAYGVPEIFKDLAGIERVIVAKKL